VLVAVDGSPASTEAARLAAAVIASAGGSLRILHVVPHGARPGWDDDAQPRGFDALEEARAVADSMCVAAAVELTEGMPGPAVAAAATRWDADLIATGDRGRSAAQRLALGSVSTWLMRHLDRSLLVARRPA
jgi:nucleotide-binding universal stress UspA family protein